MYYIRIALFIIIALLYLFDVTELGKASVLNIESYCIAQQRYRNGELVEDGGSEGAESGDGADELNTNTLSVDSSKLVILSWLFFIPSLLF